MTTFRQTVTLNWSGDGSAGVNGSVSAEGDGIIALTIPLRNGLQSVPQAIRDAGLGLLWMKPSIACTVTFRDAGGTSVGSRSLLAGVPWMWYPGLGDIPISADVATIDATAGATGSLEVRGVQDISPAIATAVFAGSFLTALESEVVTGGKVATLTLTGAEWAPAGPAFNAQRRAVINGLDSAQAEAHGWDVEKANIPDSALVRTSDTVATLTLPALGAYAITVNEVITPTIPASATTADAPIVATGTATITANS